MAGEIGPSKLGTVIGVVLILVVVLGFLLSVLLQLPKSGQAEKLAKPLQTLPRDFFSSNATTDAIRKLNKPNNVPVVVDPNQVGRNNVFEGF
jgi:hypothetical protein